ncbi:NADH:ubiquinone oxidoreductase subunit 4 (chain M) [Microbacterium testaceum]|uniref:NADH:ubiquinone oxidoreductase subunit 4 (chain M) n=1 Tax=Microbacterium testaceum TaxID=2033 RepID=UPI0012482378|nr:NADH:ubiquinone oxidoreductase subunit 4 (chain M) [Microbacterium testaceum]
MRSPWIAVTATGVAIVLGAGLWGTVGAAALAVSLATSASPDTWGEDLPVPSEPGPSADELEPPADELDPFAITEVYEVGADGTLSPEPTPEAAEVWAGIERVFTPRGAATRIEELRLGRDVSSDTMAWVSRSQSGEYWTFAANLSYADDNDYWMATLVHEYAHVLSLGPESSDTFTETCDTLWTGQGCLLADADLLTFSDLFWADYTDAPDADNIDVDIAEAFYAAHEQDFVDAYAATNVTEDFAESFLSYVSEDAVEGDDLLSRKIAFFGEYPRYVLVRERLRAELGWG